MEARFFRRALIILCAVACLFCRDAAYAAPVLHLDSSEAAVSTVTGLHSFSNADDRLHLYFVDNVGTGPDACLPRSTLRWGHISTKTGGTWDVEKGDFWGFSRYAADWKKMDGDGGIAPFASPEGNALSFAVTILSNKKGEPWIYGRHATSPEAVVRDNKYPILELNRGWARIVDVSPFSVDGGNYIAAIEIDDQRYAVAFYALEEVSPTKEPGDKEEADPRRRYTLRKSKLELQLNGVSADIRVFCRDRGNCIISLWQVRMFAQKLPQGYYMLGSFEKHDADHFGITQRTEWRTIDGGYDALVYAYASVGEGGGLFSIASGSIQGYVRKPEPMRPEYCRRALTVLRRLTIHKDHITQVPALEGYHQTGTDRAEPTLALRPVPVSGKTRQPETCGIVRRLPWRGTEPQAFALNYQFNHANGFAGAGWKMSIRSSANTTEAIVIQFNPKLETTPARMEYLVDRTTVFSFDEGQQLGEKLDNVGPEEIKGTVQVLLDDGLAEVFFEDGRYVASLLFTTPVTELDEVCIQSLGSSGFDVVKDEILTFGLQRNDERGANTVAPTSGAAVPSRLLLSTAGLLLLMLLSGTTTSKTL